MSIFIFSQYFFNKFCPVENCGVTQHYLYRDSLTFKSLRTENVPVFKLFQITLVLLFQKLMQISIKFDENGANRFVSGWSKSQFYSLSRKLLPKEEVFSKDSSYGKSLACLQRDEKILITDHRNSRFLLSRVCWKLVRKRL